MATEDGFIHFTLPYVPAMVDRSSVCAASFKRLLGGGPCRPEHAALEPKRDADANAPGVRAEPRKVDPPPTFAWMQ